MELQAFLTKLTNTPRTVEFSDTMAAIDANYDYTPTAFTNGGTENAASQNEGSCKLFAFARLQGLTEEQTLACFGQYYRQDVLGNPDGEDHQNIRNFMISGWPGVKFEGQALRSKS